MLGSGTTRSLWMATAQWPAKRDTALPERADVVVIGAGIAGLTTAYLLAREGRDVLVLDGRGIGAGETSRTTAHLADAIDDRFVEIERMHGQEGARLAAASHGAAIDCIEAIQREERISCDFRRVDGWLVLDEDSPQDLLERERDAARRAGLSGVELLPEAPAPGFSTRKALRFPRQGRVHALAYLLGLARALEGRGGRIVAGAQVERVDEEAEPTLVHLAGGARVEARSLVCCTNAPIIDRLAIHTKQAPYRTYAVALAIPRGSVPDALYWDTLDPYHYVRLQEGEDADVLIIGGEDHKTGEADDMAQRWERLERWARTFFPAAGARLHAWSGQVMEPFDGLAFIGRNPGSKDGVFVATGDSGMGMTHGTIAGMLITDLVQGRASPWAKLYDPARKQTRSLGTWTRENLDVAKQMLDHVRGSEASDTDAIAPGQGAVMREGLSHVAVYRDRQGELHRMSAVCPHMKCIVHWNPGESTWDCPCHGSRFTAKGEVIAGPASAGLARRG
jgi:glycine/D-amino acid oxidase-like deaminating enzyme/nitrite reductase/ring-hydroxylating ferredoxin subunit